MKIFTVEKRPHLPEIVGGLEWMLLKKEKGEISFYALGADSKRNLFTVVLGKYRFIFSKYFWLSTRQSLAIGKICGVWITKELATPLQGEVTGEMAWGQEYLDFCKKLQKA